MPSSSSVGSGAALPCAPVLLAAAGSAAAAVAMAGSCAAARGRRPGLECAAPSELELQPESSSTATAVRRCMQRSVGCFGAFGNPSELLYRERDLERHASRQRTEVGAAHELEQT